MTPGIRGVLIALALAAAVPAGIAGRPQGPAPQAQPPEPAPAPPPAPAQQPPQTPQAPSFRAGVELVSMNVTVTDAAARFLTDLEQDDFSVYEDGVKQDITLFNRTNLPIALALAMRAYI